MKNNEGIIFFVVNLSKVVDPSKTQKRRQWTLDIRFYERFIYFFICESCKYKIR